jgi:oligopeptide transport system permease protein
MRTYILRRLLMFIPIMLAVYTIVFIVMHATPGSPWDHGERAMSQALLDNLAKSYGLDQPLWKQYLQYLQGVVTRFDFGPSLTGGRDSNEIIRGAFPVSLQLGLVAFALSVVAGVSLGIIAALRQNTWVDYLTMLFSVIGISTPAYVITTLFVVIFAIQLHWLPTGGWGGVWDVRIIIPAVTLALGPTAIIARYMRSSLLEVIRSDYIRTARAKGLAANMIIVRHALRNAMIPVLTLSGPILASLITGSFFFESICQVPGLGRYFVQTVLTLNYPVLIATTLLYAAVIWLLNFIIDVLYVYVDPRIRFS